MKNLWNNFKPWVRLVALLLLLAALALTANRWLPFVLQLIPPLRAFMQQNAGEIQGWASGVQVVIWAVIALVVVIRFARPAPPAPSAVMPPPAPTVAPVMIDPAALAQLLGQKPSPVDLGTDTQEYLAFLVDRYRYLDFRGMGVADRIPLRLALLDLYVPLKARIELPAGETWARNLKLAGRAMSAGELAASGQHLSEAQPLAQLLQANPGLIILGDPGAGKTTFMKFLALNTALGSANELGIGQRIPFMLPLSAYAIALAQKDVPLDQCIADYWRGLCADFALAPILKAALSHGSALLLLDGLDEVREPALRRLVVDRVRDFFSRHQAQGNKFVLTSRIVGYKEVRPTADGLRECTIVDFEQSEIEHFVAQWTRAIEQAAHGTGAVANYQAEQERTALLAAVERNAGVRQLAANPLLLTILALMKRQGIELPERRVELYQIYVLTLLKHWNLARGWGRPPSRDLDEKETIKLLAPLALWMHEVSPGIGLVQEEDLKRKLVELCQQRGLPDAEAASERFLQDVHDHSALLLERGQRQYGFIHLTFQEYLAAVAIAQASQLDRSKVVQVLAAHIAAPNWHEVSLLVIGYLGLVQQNDEVASAVIADLLQQAPGESGEAVVLAGECVADGWPGVTPACRQQVITALGATLVDDKAVTPVRRAAARRALAQRNLGDPRPEVTSLDAMQFCYVPAGPFVMGSDADPQAYADEKPLHDYTIAYPYWVSRYPISNQQYSAFVTAKGYTNPAYWIEAQQQELWQAGQVREVWYTWNEKKDDLVRNLGGWRTRPANFGQPYNLPNHPAVGMNWYEALAFTRWATDYLHEKGWLAADWQAQLPNEPEWEKAARGGLEIPAPRSKILRGVDKLQPPATLKLIENKQTQRRYPWGDKAETNRMNFEQTAIKTSSALGCFPGGDSPYGVSDLSGNVWEWTRSLWGSELNTASYGYPYQPGDGREELNAPVSVRRVLRGGSSLHID